MASLGTSVDQGKGFIIDGLCYEHTLIHMASLGTPVYKGKQLIIHGLCYEHTLNTYGKSWYPRRPG